MTVRPALARRRMIRVAEIEAEDEACGRGLGRWTLGDEIREVKDWSGSALQRVEHYQYEKRKALGDISDQIVIVWAARGTACIRCKSLWDHLLLLPVRVWVRTRTYGRQRL